MSNVSTTRSKIGRDEIKWSELLSHFRTVQNKHEKARRHALGTSNTEEFVPLRGVGSSTTDRSNGPGVVNGTGRPPVRRRATGNSALNTEALPMRPPSRALSPLNPRARGLTTLSTPVASNATFVQGQGRGTPQPKRTLSLNRKS